jgi:hypothetical protein
VENIFPEAVSPAPFDVDENGNSKSGKNYLTVMYAKLVPAIVEAIKDQQLQLADIMQKIEQRGR